MPLASARSHYFEQQKIARHGLVQARKARFGSLAALLAVVAEAQAEAAYLGAAAVPAMLAEQGVDADPVGLVDAAAFAGVTSDGRDLAGLMDFMRSPQVTPAQFDRAVLTQIADAGRGSESVATTVRPQVFGYTRMLVPPSCSRCAILAGKFFKWNAGFQRHPRCDCRHIPATEDTAGDLRTDPGSYFRSLSAEQQDRAFTKAGAQAIRDGADPIQVVNARAGMSTAQVQLRSPGDRWTAKGQLQTRRVYGKQLFVTTEGTTRRGTAYKAMRENTRWGQNGDLKLPGERYARARAPRLMPESIYAIADDREHAIRLLRINGYIT